MLVPAVKLPEIAVSVWPPSPLLDVGRRRHLRAGVSDGRRLSGLERGLSTGRCSRLTWPRRSLLLVAAARRRHEPIEGA